MGPTVSLVWPSVTIVAAASYMLSYVVMDLMSLCVCNTMHNVPYKIGFDYRGATAISVASVER